jgi:hypothetical protein
MAPDRRYCATATGLHRLTIVPERPTSRASCLNRLPTRSATRSTSLCSNTSISLRPWVRKWVAGSTPGRRNQVGDAKSRTQQARALQHRRRHHLLHDRRRLVFHAQSGVAKENRQRDKDPALVADRTEIAVGDEIERFLAAMIRMHPPTDVGQQAGGVAQAAILVRFAQSDDPHQTIGPFDQLLGVTGRS